MRNTRRGYSLVECLVVISLTAVTLGTVTLTLHSLRRGDLSVRDEFGHELAIDRLANLLRQDVHRANAATLGPEPKLSESARTLQLTFGSNRSVEYSLTGDEVVRSLREGDQIQQNDSFSIRSASAGSWQLDTVRAATRHGVASAIGKAANQVTHVPFLCGRRIGKGIGFVDE